MSVMHRVQNRMLEVLAEDDGMSTAEYAIGTIAAAAFGAVLYTVVTGDSIVSVVPRHHIVRTIWVVGEGDKFVRTMIDLAERGIDPRVVNDQVGRLTFASDVAASIRHLLESGAPYGVHNVTSVGEPVAWHEVAREVFRLTGHDPDRVTGVTTDEYHASSTIRISPRPRNSVLETSILDITWRERLSQYLASTRG